MTIQTQSIDLDFAAFRRRAVDLALLTKPRVVLMVLITTSIGYYLGSGADLAWATLLHTLVGSALACAGALALNQYIERDLDALMERTRMRPLPAGRLRPATALAFGLLFALGGLSYMALGVNVLSAAVTALIIGLYLLVYTPLKLKTSLCSFPGAIAGALPPATGWVAARGEIGIEAVVLVAIMFIWQLPHSLAIGLLYREDYARAGFHILPVLHPDGRSTEWQIVANCFALLPVALLPTFIGMTGVTYFFAALTLGIGFLACSIWLALNRSQLAAQRVVIASLLYLPAQIFFMAFDRIVF